MLLNPPRESTDGGLGSLSNDHSSSNSFDVFKSYTFTTTPFCYGWLKLNSLSTSIVAINLKYQNTITIAGTFAKALLRVVLLVSARSMSLVPPSTPLCLLTMANCSSSDSLLQEASRNFDLTCSIKLLNFWLKALKDPLLINFIYPFIFLLVTLTVCILLLCYNFGISDSFISAFDIYSNGMKADIFSKKICIL